MQPFKLLSVNTNMNKIKLIIICIGLGILSSKSNAQDIVTANSEYQSIFSPLSIRGNIGLHAGTLNTGSNQLILKSGGSAAIILNHKLALGASGTGFAGSQAINNGSDKYSIFGGYGGLLIEPIIFPKQAIHLSFPTTIGAGQANYFLDTIGYRDWDFYQYETFYNDFVFIEPGVNLELNLTKFMRFGVSASYLISNTLNKSQFSQTNLDGLSIQANLKLGWFK